MRRWRWLAVAGIVLVVGAIYALEVEAQAISKAVIYVRTIIGLGPGGTVDVVGQLRASPVVTSLVHTADGGPLVLDGGGVVFPCTNVLPSCSQTVNNGVTIRSCATGNLSTCGRVTQALGFAWKQDVQQFYSFASKSGPGQQAPVESLVFSSTTPSALVAGFTVTAIDVECATTLVGSGVGQAVLVLEHDGGTKCRFNFPCTAALNDPIPLDGGIWQGPYMCDPNEVPVCVPPGPCSPLKFYYHPDSDCAANGLPGVTCTARYQAFARVP